jgi:hypothetical protein
MLKVGTGGDKFITALNIWVDFIVPIHTVAYGNLTFTANIPELSTYSQLSHEMI